MAMKDALLAELTQEAKNTRIMLSRVPGDKFDWQPHEKSMSLGKLASHIAEIPTWVGGTILFDELDFSKNPYAAPDVNNPEELLRFFDETIEKAKADLATATDENLNGNWSLRNGETIYFTLPRKVAIRNFVLNHIVHHRAQLSVYLRLLDIPVPGMYGPTADEG